ncbi:MAG: hypothetical protein ACLVAV_05215 [Clostridium sp.]
MNTKLATAQIRVKIGLLLFRTATNLDCLSKITAHSTSFQETLIITGFVK